MIQILFIMNNPPEDEKGPKFLQIREKYCERLTGEKKISLSLAFLDLLQSDNGANPESYADKQPLKNRGRQT